jgi:hypothetical protein
VTADTLKRRARQRKLVVYRPGKPYLSTLADIWAMVQLTRVGPTPSRPTSSVPHPFGPPAEMDLSSLALDQALKGSTKREPDRPKRGQRKEVWLEYEARVAAHRLEMKERRRARARNRYREKKAERAKDAPK